MSPMNNSSPSGPGSLDTLTLNRVHPWATLPPAAFFSLRHSIQVYRPAVAQTEKGQGRLDAAAVPGQSAGPP